MKRYSRAQIWEVVIVVAIILIVIYRFALVYDFVPDAYQPMTIFDNMYDGIENGLLSEASEPGMFGHIAKWALDHLKAVDKYLYDQKMNYEKAEEVAKRCNENMLFRYFMDMGDEGNPNCIKTNVMIDEATKQVSESAARPAPTDTTSYAPSAAEPPYNPVGSASAAPAVPIGTSTAAPVVKPPPAPTPQPAAENSSSPVGRQPVSVAEPAAVPAN